MSEPIVLDTLTTTYRMMPTASGTGLQMVAWGPLGDVAEPLPMPSHPSFDVADDLAPHEFAVAGTRHALESELIVRRPDGSIGTLVHLQGAPQVVEGRSGRVVRATLADDHGEVAIDLEWHASTDHDVITRVATVHNRGSETIMLRRALTGAFNLPLPDGCALDVLAGAWCEEFTPHRVLLPRGTWSAGSRQGLVSHLWAPVVTVTDPTGARAGCWSIAVDWPGSWQLDVHATNRVGWVRVAGGLNDESEVSLTSGASVTLPAMHGLWAPSTDGVADAWHRWQRATLLRRAPSPPALTYNSWYATEFDVSSDQQLDLARLAARAGCTMFVLDDGWFRGRKADNAGLGDWQPDPDTFPNGLMPLVSGVHDLGMRFGLWVEPEAVNPDSDLFRAHPDWIHRSPDREPVLVRNQYVLDLGLPEVEQWVGDTLRHVLSTSGVDHLKWDMNRPITDGQPGARAHAEAYLRVLDLLREEFPQITLEACSAGGARISYGVLARCDAVWPSDETGPRDRLAIQHGFLSVLPAAVMSSWVTHVDGMRDPRPVSLVYRFCVAMCGLLGIGADLTTWGEEEFAVSQDMTRRYKHVQQTILGGTVRRHGDPREHGYVVEFTDEQRSVFFVFGPDELTPVRIRSATAVARQAWGLDLTAGQISWDDDALVLSLDPSAGAAMVCLERP